MYIILYTPKAQWEGRLYSQGLLKRPYTCYCTVHSQHILNRTIRLRSCNFHRPLAGIDSIYHGVGIAYGNTQHTFIYTHHAHTHL